MVFVQYGNFAAANSPGTKAPFAGPACLPSLCGSYDRGYCPQMGVSRATPIFLLFSRSDCAWLLPFGSDAGRDQPKGWFALWLGAAVFISLISLVVYVLTTCRLSCGYWACGTTSYTCRSPSLSRKPLNVTTYTVRQACGYLGRPHRVRLPRAVFLADGGWLNVGAGGAPPPIFRRRPATHDWSLPQTRNTLCISPLA